MFSQDEDDWFIDRILNGPETGGGPIQYEESSPIYPPSPAYHTARRELKEYNAMDMIERRRESARRTIERAEAELERLASLPSEPVLEDDPCPVIYFVKSFGGGVDYDYAAIKAGDGLWYTTGPKAPKGYSWENLVNWMFSEGDSPSVMIGTKWEPVV